MTYHPIHFFITTLVAPQVKTAQCLNKNAQTKYAQTPMAKVAMIAGQMA
jgi:hypothetical protein